MARLTDLPVEIIEGIMEAAHAMPYGQIDSRHIEQIPAATTFGAMRLVCRELNAQVFKRYVETLFSVHTVMLEKPNLQALLDLAKNEHFRNSLCTLFVDARVIYYEVPDFTSKQDQTYLNEMGETRDTDRIGKMFLLILDVFPNLREISIEHFTIINDYWTAPRMVCLGATAMQKIFGDRPKIITPHNCLRSALHTVFNCIGSAKKELIDLQIRIVCRETAKSQGDFIEWSRLVQLTHEEGLTTKFLDLVMNSEQYSGIKVALQSLKTLALPIRGPTLDVDDMYLNDPEDEDLEVEVDLEFDPEVVAKFISLSPDLGDLTVYFGTGDTQPTADIEKAIPWTNLPYLWALELGGAKFDYKKLIAGLALLKNTLRTLILRHVQLKTKTEWINLIRFLHTKMPLVDFEIWEPAEEHRGPICFRTLTGKCFKQNQPYRAWRVRKILPENLEKYLVNLKETKMHNVSYGCTV